MNPSNLPLDHKFVFISYKSQDRELIQPYLRMLDSIGVNYWWDQRIIHQWDKEIDEKLAACSAVIGFLTERSTESSAVFEECRTANENSKFIPVKLDQSYPRYAFRALIAFLNYVDLSSVSAEKNETEKSRLIDKVQRLVGSEVQPPSANTEIVSQPVSLDRWIKEETRLQHIAYLVALCFFEGQNHDQIQMYASIFEDKLREAGLHELFKLNSNVVVKKDKLQIIEAESIKYTSKTLQHDVEFIKFENHLFSEELLLYVWNEMDQLKDPIVQWIDAIIEGDPESIADIATGLSKIGRKNFLSIYSIFLHRWLGGRSHNKFRCADITLSLMAGDPNIRSYIREKLFNIADSQQGMSDLGIVQPVSAPVEASGPSIKENVAPDQDIFINDFAAIDLVTGYTGMAMPDLSIHVLKKIEANLFDPTASSHAKGKSISRLENGIRFILRKSKTEPYAKSMLKVFGTGIKTWALENADEKRSFLPEFIFKMLLEDISIGWQRELDTISLSDLFSEDGRLEGSLIRSFANVISSALECKNTFIRDLYKNLFKQWVGFLTHRKNANDKSSELNGILDADLKAFTALFSQVLSYASTEDDKDRIRYLTKSICAL
jgi:TIR domain